MMAELVDWLSVSVIKHVWSATSFLSLDDLYRDIAEWANANACFGIVQASRCCAQNHILTNGDFSPQSF